jgi:glc operon protein GlcG
MSRFRFTALIAIVGFGMLTRPAFGQEKPLISRGHIQLNLAGAETIIAAARQKAASMNVKLNIAVVDDGGHLLAFARMDGARPASGTTAMTKAISAATFRQETGTLPANGTPDTLLSLSVQNAAHAGGGRITTLKGGIPVVVEGQIIGAVGCGGGTGDQDAQAGKAGIQVLLDELARNK